MKDAKQNTLDVLTEEISIANALLIQAEEFAEQTKAIYEKAQARVSTIKKTRRYTIKKHNDLMNS